MDFYSQQSLITSNDKNVSFFSNVVYFWLAMVWISESHRRHAPIQIQEILVIDMTSCRVLTFSLFHHICSFFSHQLDSMSHQFDYPPNMTPSSCKKDLPTWVKFVKSYHSQLLTTKFRLKYNPHIWRCNMWMIWIRYTSTSIESPSVLGSHILALYEFCSRL